MKQLQESLTGGVVPVHEMEEVDVILRVSFRLPLM